MEIKGKRSFTITKLNTIQLLTIQAALNEFYKDRLDTLPGQAALQMMNQINDHRGCGGG